MTTRRPLVTLRPDAGPGCGRGHVARCAALAAALRARGARTATWLPKGEPPERSTGTVLRSVASARAGGAGAREMLRRTSDAWVVDSYRLGASDRSALQRHAPLWVPLDRPAARARADGVFAPYAHPRGTARDVDAARRLFGPRFAVLPGDGPPERRSRDDGRVLVSFGAEDHLGLTVPVATAIARDGVRVLAVLGGGVADRGARLRELRRLAPLVETADGRHGLRRLFGRADSAVLAPGQSLWEALRGGLAVVIVETAPNQRAARRWARANGVALDAGVASAATAGRMVGLLRRLRRDPRGTRAMVRRARRLLDGRGADRVARAILASIGGSA